MSILPWGQHGLDTMRARIQWVDYVRAAAICCVVLCHATEGIYDMNLEQINEISASSRVFCYMSFTVGRLGVPMFLMITGSLLLGREYDENSIRSFWRNKWFHLLVCTLFWFAVYDILIHFGKHVDVGILQFVADLMFIHKVEMSHVWYMPMILGIYILIPLVSNMLIKFDLRMFCFPIIIFSFYSFVVPLIDEINQVINPGLAISRQFSLGFSGGAYGLYLIYGYLVKIGIFKKVKSILLLIISMVALGGTVVLQIWSYRCGVGYNVWYDCLLLLIGSVCLYELGSRMHSTYGYSVVKCIADYSFPIYITHIIIRGLFKSRIRALPIMLPIKVLVLWNICMVMSLLLSILISRIPKFGKYLLYMK